MLYHVSVNSDDLSRRMLQEWIVESPFDLELFKTTLPVKVGWRIDVLPVAVHDHADFCAGLDVALDLLPFGSRHTNRIDIKHQSGLPEEY